MYPTACLFFLLIISQSKKRHYLPLQNLPPLFSAEKTGKGEEKSRHPLPPG